MFSLYKNMTMSHQPRRNSECGGRCELHMCESVVYRVYINQLPLKSQEKYDLKSTALHFSLKETIGKRGQREAMGTWILG